MSLVQQLVKKGMIAKEQASLIESELKDSKKKTEEVILEKKILPEKVLFDFKEENLKIPLKEVVVEEIPLKVLELIPEESARFYYMIPLKEKDGVLEIGMVYPEDLNAKEALKFLARRGNFKYEIFLITPTTFKNLISQYRNLKKEVTKALEELQTEFKTEEAGTRERILKRTPATESELERIAEEAPITKVVAVILRHAVEGGASDIHIEPTKEKLKVRFRLMGMLHASLFLPISVHPAVVARIKILSNLKIDETRMPQDGRFSTKIADKDIDFRVSTFPTPLGEKVVIRVLDPAVGLRKFDQLGLIGRDFEIVQEAVQKPYGLILSTGPTGSGKTTTLYAILRLLNKEGVNIVTIEDPVEYFIEGINQSQIKPEIGYTFATGLRHILRQDPDIIMVGEIRDQETATLVTHAALTGHIVLSTLHTNDAVGAIPRIIDLGVEPFLIPSSLSVVIAQRLIRKLCPKCREKIQPKPKIRNMIVKEIENLPPEAKKNIKNLDSLSIFKPVGCKECGKSGYLGRIGLFEVLKMTDDLSELITKAPTEIKIIESAKKQGMITMKQDGILKALRGITTIEEIIRVAEEK